MISLDEECPPLEEVTPGGGAYASPGGAAISIDEARFPQGRGPKRMTVDHESGTIRIEYTPDGRDVVETWRITDSRSHQF